MGADDQLKVRLMLKVAGAKKYRVERGSKVWLVTVYPTGKGYVLSRRRSRKDPHRAWWRRIKAEWLLRRAREW